MVAHQACCLIVSSQPLLVTDQYAQAVAGKLVVIPSMVPHRVKLKTEAIFWFMESIPQLLTLGPFSVCFGQQPHPIFWLSGQDYARTVVACVQQPAASRNQIFTLQGIESHRMLDALRLLNQAARTGKASLRLPLGLLTIPARFSEQYAFNQQVMRYYNQRRKRFESQAAHRLLHQLTIALSEFARLFKSVSAF